jgi:NAD(P)-dependent dehydrogenase (short-subunit alcohol dehydrogenase family)
MSDRPLALVTGASRGIGRAIALALAAAGYDLALTAGSDQAQLRAVADEAGRLGAACRTALCDLTDAAAVAGLHEALGVAPERYRALVNNAGYAGRRADLADAELDDIDAILNLNLRGLALMCRAAIPLLAANGGGAIVNLSSQSAQFGGIGLSVYAASKAAVNGLTVSLAREVAAKGVRVNAISPGPVMTEPLLALPADRLEQMQSGLPMGRFCTAEEVAAVAVWLLSNQASYVSGAIVPVHGAR